RPELREEVVRVALEEVTLPEADEEVLERGEAGLAVLPLPVELLRQAPAGIDATEEPERRLGPTLVPAASPLGIELEGALQRLEEVPVVLARARRALERKQTAHEVRVAHAPLECLLGAHRAAEHELQLLDPEGLRHEPVLRADVVEDRDVG